MGDTISETSTSSCWAKDELEFVDERQQIKQPLSRKDTLNTVEGDEPVSAAVSLVVSSARHGVIALCANVAHILREKKKLQERVAALEKLMTAMENNSSGVSSVNGSCSEHCQATDLHSLQESPVSQRCGSAPAGFIASGLRFLKSGDNHDQNFIQANSSNHSKKDSECCCIKERGLRDCRTSRHSMPETNSNLLTKISNDRKEAFNRGPRQTSTRSLDISHSLPPSSFVRRKYSTISLRRVRRTPAARQKTCSTGSSVSVNSNASSTFAEMQPKCSGSSSCVVTVAEVHTPPPQQIPTENAESEAVKLLARTLTSVLQGDVFEQEKFISSSSEETPGSQVFKPLSHSELCLPHPLAGCECVVCLSLAADPNCHLFALTTEGGSLLPPGSRVLIEGERVGTVLYLGHNKYSSSSQCSLLCGPSDTYLSHEEYIRPVGVTVKLWAPDQGEVFVPLNAVICQLDDDMEIHHKESLSNSEYEYLAVDSDDEYVFPSPEDLVEAKNSKRPPDQTTCRTLSTKEEKPVIDQYFIRSPSISSYNSDTSHSLGDLSAYGLDCGDDELEFSKELNMRSILDGVLSLGRVSSSQSDNPHLILSGDSCESQAECYSNDTGLNTTFLCKVADESDFSRSDIRREKSISLYDTFDSAISLSFSRRLQPSEENSEPSSVNGTGRESPHFGDTWDSGCSVGRGRCKSDSSGNFSDVEPENRLGITFAKSLGDALNAVLEKHKIKYNNAFKNNKINHDKNMHGSNVFPCSELCKRYHFRKAVPQLPELLLKEKELQSSHRYKINGSVADQSEV